MRRITSSLVLVGCLVVAATAGTHRRPSADCPADRVAAVLASCPCDGRAVGNGAVQPWPTHEAYVECVARAACTLRRGRCASARVRERLVRCAWRSRCGRPGAVVCHGADGAGLRVARSADRCVAKGGTVTTARSVCDGWVPVTTTTLLLPVATSTTTTTTTSSTTTTIPATMGNDVEFPYASSHAPGYLLGGPIHVPRPITLTHLAVIAKAADAQVVLALYTTDAGGAPDALVAATAPATMAVGRNEIDVPGVSLAPGTYWLLGAYDTDTSIGFDTAAGAPVRYVEHVFGDPLPQSLGASWSYEGQRFNYYVRGY